jgi:hypothetical protein
MPFSVMATKLYTDRSISKAEQGTGSDDDSLDASETPMAATRVQDGHWGTTMGTTILSV